MFKFTKSWRSCVAMTGICIVLLQPTAAQTPPPGPTQLGDLNGDGAVNDADAAIWFGNSAAHDANGDGRIDRIDFYIAFGFAQPPPPGDPNMPPPPPGDPYMPPPPPGDGTMPPMGDAPMSPDGALLVGPGMFDNVPPECSDEVRNIELLPEASVEKDGMSGYLYFLTVCNSPGFENNAITLPAGRKASGFDVEAATQGKIFFGVAVEGGAPIWTTADGKGALDGLHITSARPSPNGKYMIFIDPEKSDPGVRVTVSFVDHQ